MKYMGSKRTMLRNGLGELIGQEIGRANKFVDLFAGSGVVGIHVARKYGLPVHAYDLQQYSAVLSGAIIERTKPIEWQSAWENWFDQAKAIYLKARVPDHVYRTGASIKQARQWCAGQKQWPLTQAYGGHYFSPQQAMWLDALRRSLPGSKPNRTVALAALIQASSQCAAAPGHTAQPFQPTRTAKPHLLQAWSKDFVDYVKVYFRELAGVCAKKTGHAGVKDANVAVISLKMGDLVFVDPPYSGVQYSRFYHVLESVASGFCGTVSGVGRYPVAALRPRSSYSLTTRSESSMDELLQSIAARGARAIVTFPDHECSNGLSGDAVMRIGQKYFRLTARKTVESRFSTLGGSRHCVNTNSGRLARQNARELLLVLDPK